MKRKEFIKLAGILTAVAASGSMDACTNGSLAGATAGKDKAGRADKAVFVPAGKSRGGETQLIWGIIPHQVMLSGRDTEGELFVFGHAGMGKGGPPRHFHYEDAGFRSLSYYTKHFKKNNILYHATKFGRTYTLQQLSQ